MSFILIQDSCGEDMIISLKRVDKIELRSISPEETKEIQELHDIDIGTYTEIRLLPLDKGEPYELVYSATSVADIWDQIKLRM